MHTKKRIVQAFDQLQEDNPIKNQLKLITKSEIIKKIDELIPLKIGQNKIILFYEKL